MVPWCSGLTCGPVKAEIAGSNPVGTARRQLDVFHQVVFLIAFQNYDVLLAQGVKQAVILSEFDSLVDSNHSHLLTTGPLVMAELTSIAFFIADCIEKSLITVALF